MNHTDPQRTLELARARFDHTAAQHGVQAPVHLLDNAGAPFAELMQFRKATGVSLDYLFSDE